MNKKLIKALTQKWSQPEGLPAKGSELVKSEDNRSPCAQSEAVMLSKGIGVVDFEAFLGGLPLSHFGQGMNLDKFTAKTLGISVTHSVLLRRFNDLSSLSPAIVLNEPEKILGKNWGKVLEFWYFIDTLSQEVYRNLTDRLQGVVGTEEYRAKKKSLKLSTEGLDIIVPDLYYVPGISTKPLDICAYDKKTEDEVLKENPSFKFHYSYSSNQHQPIVISNWPDHHRATVVGDYSRAYFGWIAPYDYFRSNLPSGPDSMKLQVLFACATNEIQILEEGQTYEDLYFCKIIGYNPLKNPILTKTKRKFKEVKQSLSEAVSKYYRVIDNTIFSRFSKNEDVRQTPTKEMVDGLVELSVNDLVFDAAYEKVVRTYNFGKGRFFGIMRIKVPKLGADTEANNKFYELVQKLEDDFSVWPLSFCDKDDLKGEEGSEWAITSKRETGSPKVNAPKGYGVNGVEVTLIPRQSND